MKNLSLTILLVFVPFFLQADNWELFPFNQKTYYYFQTGDVESIAPYYIDFEEFTDEEVLQYPLRAYIESLGICYPVAPFGGNPKLNDVFFKSSSNNQMQGYIYKPYFYPTEVPENIEELQDTLAFYPLASVGDSWEIRTQAFSKVEFPFSHLIVTCTSVAFESIVGGVEDSTKTFHVQAFVEENAVSSDFDEVTIKLSKQYGLLEWVAFSEWLTYDLKTNITIAGIQKDDNTVLGERTPLVEDFFPYEVGDFLKWQYRKNDKVEIHEDEIIEVNHSLYNLQLAFNRKTIFSDGSVEIENNLIGNIPYFSQHYIDLAYWQVGIDTMYLEIDTTYGYASAPYKDIVLQRIPDSDCGLEYQLKIEDTTCTASMPTTDEKGCRGEVVCLTSDCYFCQTKYFSTQLGTTSITTNTSLNFSYLDLIEASIGDCYFTNIKEEESYFASQITLNPNPTTHRFVLQNPKQSLQNQNLQLKITDIHGRTLQQMPLSQSSIEVDLSEYSNGIYLVQISDGKSWWTEKVVKY